jgi:hypothetical protein
MRNGCIFLKNFDGEEEIVMRRSGFIFSYRVDNFLQFFKVQSKFDPSSHHRRF